MGCIMKNLSEYVRTYYLNIQEWSHRIISDNFWKVFVLYRKVTLLKLAVVLK